jgi:hypothetical protein
MVPTVNYALIRTLICPKITYAKTADCEFEPYKVYSGKIILVYILMHSGSLDNSSDSHPGIT